MFMTRRAIQLFNTKYVSLGVTYTISHFFVKAINAYALRHFLLQDQSYQFYQIPIPIGLRILKFSPCSRHVLIRSTISIDDRLLRVTIVSLFINSAYFKSLSNTTL